jgi:hypothetical protein
VVNERPGLARIDADAARTSPVSTCSEKSLPTRQSPKLPVSRPGEYGDDEVKVFVVATDATFDFAAWLKFRADRMTYFMVPACSS